MVPAPALAGLAAVVVAGASMTRADRRLPLVAPILLVLLSAACGLWYAAIPEALLIIPLGVTFLASLAMVVREPAQAPDVPAQVRRVLVWYGMVLAAIASTWAAYFQFVTLQFPLEEERRLVLTAVWMLGGVALVLVGRKRELPAARDAGFALLAAALAKLVFYDTTHLFGLARIAGLAGGGALLLASTWLAAKMAPREEVAQ